MIRSSTQQKAIKHLKQRSETQYATVHILQRPLWLNSPWRTISKELRYLINNCRVNRRKEEKLLEMPVSSNNEVTIARLRYLANITGCRQIKKSSIIGNQLLLILQNHVLKSPPPSQHIHSHMNRPWSLLSHFPGSPKSLYSSHLSNPVHRPNFFTVLPALDPIVVFLACHSPRTLQSILSPPEPRTMPCISSESPKVLPTSHTNCIGL